MIKLNIRKKLNMPDGIAELVIDTQLPLNNITALFGRSGAGKTSLLKILAGLMQPETGYIEVAGVVWLDTEKKINLSPQMRDIGFVFQNYALFPNMTIKQNLFYAAGKNGDHRYADHLLQVTGLTAFADHKPATLSGGQKQRAALARALVRKPALLLFDEPLSAIDADTRYELQEELTQLHREYNFTAILVSHNTDEIFKLASHVLCINEGAITQSGTPVEVFASIAADNKLTVTGVIVATNDNYMTVLIDKQLLTLKNAENKKIGDTVALNFQHTF